MSRASSIRQNFELRSTCKGEDNPQIPKFFIFGIVTVEEKGNHIIPFKPQQSHGDDGWWSGWQQRRGCYKISLVHLDSHSKQACSYLCLSSQSPSVDLRNGVGATGNGLVAALAVPDANSLALDGVLTAEGADVAGVLGDFHLLHLLTQGGTVSIQGELWSIFESFFRSFLQAGSRFD